MSSAYILLSKNRSKLFAELDEEAFAAASLGQVHRGRLHDGDDVIVKIQYPGVEDTVAQDLKNLKTLLQTFTLIARDVMRQKVNIDEVYTEFEERLAEERAALQQASIFGNKNTFGDN